jgi:hypothetical protein
LRRRLDRSIITAPVGRSAERRVNRSAQTPPGALTGPVHENKEIHPAENKVKLTDITLGGYGRFCEESAAFACERFHLPAKWDYVYTNARALLRVKHDGGGYLQIDPPGGPAMFRQERGEDTPTLLTWIIPEARASRRSAASESGSGKPSRAFTNFWLPTVPSVNPGTEPEEYTCTFSPDAARFRLRHDGWLVETELWVVPRDSAAVMTVSVTNTARKRRACVLSPVLRPHLAPFSLAPWDMPQMYQTSAFATLRSGASPRSTSRRTLKTDAIWFETRNPAGDPSKRLRAALLSDLNASAFEVSLAGFCGAGEWTSPQSVWRGRLARRVRRSRSYRYGKADAGNAALGQSIVAALARRVTLAPGKRHEFTVVLGKLPDTPDGKLPPKGELTKLARYLKPEVRERALRQIRRRYEKFFALRRVETPDACMSRYVNEFLPLQLEWVNLLDRGWPTGMRGTRDAAQDATGMVPLDPALARKRLVEILSLQRSDGWFLRQYSTAGHEGKHDHRPYVDSAFWVWEFLWEYISYTRDFAVLKEKLRWLDSRARSAVIDHVLRLFGYYLEAENLGEHGLCKIRGGDWNDSVNAAGLEGRGESVMVSCQVVLALERAGELLDYLAGSSGGKKLAAVAGRFRAGARRLRASLLKSARNARGYFSGVYNDAGNWVFSPRDPDGRSRVSGPANSFAVIAGIVHDRARDRLFDVLNGLKGRHGWRLFYPPIGEPPIEKLGRIGQGDLAPGLSENGTCYNHGCHGFLGRAAWTAGRGSMLHEILRYMFSYDQKAHPVDVARTAPYGVVNQWKEAIGLDGVGGDTFLSGSISTALRNCYQGMVGFRPELRHLVIDPCIPAGWKGLAADIPFLGAHFRIRVSNPEHVECGVAELRLDGKRVDHRLKDERLGRTVHAIPISELSRGVDHVIDARLGTPAAAVRRRRPRGA